eukprot:COSAG02_NODE_4155_length_5706_cov_2.002854_2_plen_88_part_00
MAEACMCQTACAARSNHRSHLGLGTTKGLPGVSERWKNCTFATEGVSFRNIHAANDRTTQPNTRSRPGTLTLPSSAVTCMSTVRGEP